MTNENYPIKNAWIFKQLISFSMLSSFWIIFIFITPLITFMFNKIYGVNLSVFSKLIIIFFIFLLILLVPTTIAMIIFYLIRKNFHYQMDEKIITLEQGIINKQKRYIPYSTIQNISIDYDLIDKFLGLANLNIENASSNGGANILPKKKNIIHFRHLGFKGNRVNILGIDPKNAEELKLFILKKIKENPTTTNSGL